MGTLICMNEWDLNDRFLESEKKIAALNVEQKSFPHLFLQRSNKAFQQKKDMRICSLNFHDLITSDFENTCYHDLSNE